MAPSKPVSLAAIRARAPVRAARAALLPRQAGRVPPAWIHPPPGVGPQSFRPAAHRRHGWAIGEAEAAVELEGAGGVGGIDTEDGPLEAGVARRDPGQGLGESGARRSPAPPGRAGTDGVDPRLHRRRLPVLRVGGAQHERDDLAGARLHHERRQVGPEVAVPRVPLAPLLLGAWFAPPVVLARAIGRASWRGRVCQYG